MAQNILHSFTLPIEVINGGQKTVLLTEIAPTFKYENNVVTSEQIGFSCTVLLTANAYQRIKVKLGLDSVNLEVLKTLVGKPVEFDGFEAKIYFNSMLKRECITASATSIRPAK